MKTNLKKLLCKVMATSLVLTSVGSISVLNAKAASTTDIIWETKHTLDFDELTSLETTSTELYGANAALTDTGRSKNALKLTTEAENVDTDGKFGLKLSAFADSENADEVKLEFYVKFSDTTSGTTASGFASFNSYQAKIKDSAGTRKWGLRLRDNRYACFTNAEVTGTRLSEGWYKITHEFVNETDTATVTFTDPAGNAISESATINGIQAYLFGCDGYKGELLIDDITVSYGTYNTVETAEDFALNFDNLTEGDLFAHDKVTQQNITATVMNTEADGNFLRLTCADSASETKNSFQIKAFENAETADVVTLEYDARLPQASEEATDGWATMPSLNTKYKGLNASGGNANTWAARVRGNLTQANGSAVRDTVNIGTDWFKVLHVLDKSEGTLTTTVTAKDGTSHTNSAKYAPATISYYELIATDVTILDYVDIDNINLAFTYEGPSATVEIYEDDTLQEVTEVSPAANKIVVTFDKDVKESTISQGTVMLLDSEGNTVAYNGTFADNVYTMVPNAAFSAGKSYQVYVDGVESIYGAAMEKPVTVDFKIAGEATLDKTECAKSFELTFDDISSIADLENAEVTTTATSVTSDEISLVADTQNGGNYVKITAGRALRIKGFDNIQTADRVIIEYDGMLSDTTTSGIGGTFMPPTGGANSHGMRVSYNWASYPGNTGSAHTAVADAWYHVKMDFDPKTGLISSEVTVPEGATEIPSKTDETETGTAIADGLSAFDLHRNAKSATAYYDNFKVTFVYNTPEVTAEDVVFVSAEGEDVKDLTNVPSTATAVKVDFGTTMDTSTINADNVYITKKDDTTKLAYYPTYSGTVLKLTLADALELETDYVLHITDSVANVAGATAQATEIPFTTGAGEVKATLTGLTTASGAAITNIESLNTAKTATIEIDYKNSTKQAQSVNVIVAYYSDNQLLKAELVKTENIAADVTAMTYKYDFTAPDLTDVTEVKIMSWSAFSTMRPMSESITLK